MIHVSSASACTNKHTHKVLLSQISLCVCLFSLIRFFSFITCIFTLFQTSQGAPIVPQMQHKIKHASYLIDTGKVFTRYFQFSMLLPLRMRCITRQKTELFNAFRFDKNRTDNFMTIPTIFVFVNHQLSFFNSME